jgi:superfamily II DNA or RNA helicase
MPVLLAHTLHETGVSFHVTEKPLLGREKILTIQDWPQAIKDFAVLSKLQSWLANPVYTHTETTLTLPFDVLAGVSETLAQRLRLPANTPYVLNLNHEGTIDQAHFRFRYDWLQNAQQRAVGIKRQGCFLKHGSKTMRIADPLYGIVEAIERYNAEAATAPDRMQLLADALAVLPEDAMRTLKVGGILQNTRIAQANAFSLDLAVGADGFTAMPVLFNRTTSAATEENDSDFETGEDSETPEKLLSPALHDTFTRRFVQYHAAQPVYVLERGWYVLLNDEVRQTLSVVRQVLDADAETRKAFAQSPQRYLKQRLEGVFDEEQIERIFVETSEFSQRVLDIGLWQPRVLPWVKMQGQQWFPEDPIGIKVGNDYIPLEPQEIPGLIERVKTAHAAGHAVVTIQRKSVPTEAALDALTQIIDTIFKPVPQPPDGGKAPPPKIPPQFLIIKANLEQLDYTSEVKPRTAAIQSEIPSVLKSSFKPHQAQGFAWLKACWREGKPGVLLADDMGLGKTFQAMAFLAWLQQGMRENALRKQPILIVAPTSLLKNWEEKEPLEHLHTPYLGEMLAVYGTALKRLRTGQGKDTRDGQSTLNTAALQAADVVLTTYETLRDYHLSFGSIRFAVGLFDEMQKIKTPSSQLTDACKSQNIDFVIGITGTPIENRLADLWCLFDRIAPGKLGELSAFSKTYEKDAREEDLRMLKKMLSEEHGGQQPYMLRRMKHGTLEGLPDKREFTEEAEMPPKQAKAFDDAVALVRQDQKGSALKALQALRKVSLHPAAANEEVNAQTLIEDSARFQKTFEILERIYKKGEKALIFLESHEYQDLLCDALRSRFSLPQRPYIINGTTHADHRQKYVDDFQRAPRGFDVMILSPKAAGVGLTITAANHVIHLQRWWNPAVEDQATDRAYRIGQQKDVHVYYPMAIHPVLKDDSFDKKLDALMREKRELSRDMLLPTHCTARDTDMLLKGICDRNDQPENAANLFLMDIDRKDSGGLERWAMSVLKQKGYVARLTQDSWDAGADVIAERHYKSCHVIVQCKFTLNTEGKCKESVVDQLLNARRKYSHEFGAGKCILIAITNARGFAARELEYAANCGVRLVARDGLKDWVDKL